MRHQQTGYKVPNSFRQLGHGRATVARQAVNFKFTLLTSPAPPPPCSTPGG